METENEMAARFRRRMLAISEEFCALANEASAAGFAIGGHTYVDPEGKYRALGPTVSKIIPYEPGSPQPPA